MFLMYVKNNPLPWKGVCVHTLLRNTCILIMCNVIVVTGGWLITCVFPLVVVYLPPTQDCIDLFYTSVTTFPCKI